MYERAINLNDSKRLWPFLDPPNTAVFTSVLILDEADWVHYVSHDEEDGAWQFHPYSGMTNEEEAAVVSLDHMLRIEPRLKELADLPLGWHAWRGSKNDPWTRAPKNAG
jgi:hypothetical protein